MKKKTTTKNYNVIHVALISVIAVIHVALISVIAVIHVDIRQVTQNLIVLYTASSLCIDDVIDRIKLASPASSCS